MDAAAEPSLPEVTIPANGPAVLIRGVPVRSDSGSLERKGCSICYILSKQPRFYITLDGSFEQYIQDNFSSKTRSTLKRKVKKFRERCGGELAWKSYSAAGDMGEFHKHARFVAERSYQEKLFGAGIPEDDSFLARMQKDAQMDKVRAYLLFHGELPVSYLYLRATDDTLIYEFLGYLPEYAQWSVGTVLQWLALESLFEEDRYRLLDFTEGDGEHKRMFATSSVQVANVLFLRWSVLNYMLVVSHRCTNRFSGWCGGAAKRLGVHRRLKRFIRFGRAPVP